MSEVIFIPGLGGWPSITGQRAYINYLNLFQRSRKDKIHFFDPQWHTTESYREKYDRLRQAYQRLGRPTVGVAQSAGGTLLQSLFSEFGELEDAHFICAKVNNPENIPERRKPAPSFRESARVGHDSMAALLHERPDLAGNMTCYVPDNPDGDGVLSRDDMLIEGARIVTLEDRPHAKAIAFALKDHLPQIG